MEISNDINRSNVAEGFSLPLWRSKDLRYILFSLNVILAYPVVGLVYIYQKTISPDHGVFKFLHPYGYCKFYPSCSEYTRQVLMKEGLLGLPKAIKRLASCSPASLGGVDIP